MGQGAGWDSQGGFPDDGETLAANPQASLFTGLKSCRTSGRMRSAL